MAELTSNEGKNLTIEVDGVTYSRLPLHTHVVTEEDDICDVAETYATPFLRPGDTLFISEKCVACTQQRAIPMKDIKPRRLAVILSHFVTKTPHGIGLGIPETMEYAIRECGTLRILFAAFCAAVGKLFGQHGWFYMIAGRKAAAIDGPCPNTIPPYNECVVLGPEDPEKASREIAERIGFPVLIVDLNDLGGNILGASDAGRRLGGDDRQPAGAVGRANPDGDYPAGRTGRGRLTEPRPQEQKKPPLRRFFASCKQPSGQCTYSNSRSPITTKSPSCTPISSSFL